MSNKKITTYVLLAVSILVWVPLAVKIFKSLVTKETVAPPSFRREAGKTVRNVKLLLDYPDPFLGETKSPPLIEKIREKEVTEEVADMLPDFGFKGIIRLDNLTYILLNRDGEDIMIGAKERIGDFIVSGFSEDSVVVRRGRRSFTLYAE